MSNDIVARFLRLPYCRRRNALKRPDLRLRGSHPRVERTKDDVAEYLKEHSVTSTGRLRELRRTDGACPPVQAVVALYGSWADAKRELFPELAKKQTIHTPEQLVELVGRVPIRNWREYQRLRKSNPFLLPPSYLMLHWFGTWNNLKRLACARQLTNIMNRYIILKRQVGRWPTNQECKDAGVEIDTLLAGFASRKELREMAVILEAGSTK